MGTAVVVVEKEVLVLRPEGWRVLTVTVTVAVTTGCASQAGGSRGGVVSTQGAPATENLSVWA